MNVSVLFIRRALAVALACTMTFDANGQTLQFDYEIQAHGHEAVDEVV